jgi:hypothetical protein
MRVSDRNDCFQLPFVALLGAARLVDVIYKFSRPSIDRHVEFVKSSSYLLGVDDHPLWSIGFPTIDFREFIPRMICWRESPEIAIPCRDSR